MPAYHIQDEVQIWLRLKIILNVAVIRMIQKNRWSWEKIKDWCFRDHESITIEKCFKYNLDFLKSIKNKQVYKEIFC